MIPLHPSSMGTLFAYYLEVPDYQRSYSWDDENVEDMYYDFLNFLKTDEDSYLFGQVILHKEKKGNREIYNIVDGQQRISTSTIFLCAIRDYVKAAGIDSQKILSELTNTIGFYEDDSNEFKLKMNSEDYDFFFNYIQLGNHEIESVTDSEKRIENAYRLLRNHIDNLVNDFESDVTCIKTVLNKFLDNFQVVVIEESSLQRAFIIFETLNARGKPLEVSDLLKNHFYSRLDDGHDYLKKQWMNMVETIPAKSISQYIKYYWNSYHDIVRMKNLFNVISHDRSDIHELMKDIIKYSDIYVSMINFKNKSRFSDECVLIFKMMREVGATSFFPLIIAMCRKNLKDEVINVLKPIETLILRNQVILKKTANSNEVFFSKLAYELSNDIKTVDEVIQEIVDETSPDNEIEQAFITFSPKQSVGKRILINMCKNKNPEINIDERKVDLEHIMPQTKGEWDIEDDIWKEYHVKIGNMALLYDKKNYSLKNKLYSEKKKIYLKSSIPDTRDIAEKYDKWTDEEIDKRQNELYESFIKFWPKEIC